ncbi:MAG: type IV pilin protein [Candidatus Omnitrophica bacterium]|nr:type IV pilin protein [Candidatus Omnitrophota bacterium]
MNRNKAFTLLELIVVIIIIGILATLGLTQYTRIVEKGRKAEAAAILGEARTLQSAYYTQNGAWATSYTDLGISVPASCTSTHYYSYTIYSDASGTRGVGARCTSGGKSPNWTGTGYCVAVWSEHLPGDTHPDIEWNGCGGGCP